MKPIRPILLFAMVFPTLMAWLYFFFAPTHPATAPFVKTLYSGGKVLQFSLPLLGYFFLAGSKHSTSAPHLRRPGLAFALGFGFLVFALILICYFTLLRSWLEEIGVAAMVRKKLAEFDLSTPIHYCLFAAFLSVIHSFLEEYYWRWFVYGRLRQEVPVAVALTVSSLAFMSHHVLVLAAFFPNHFLSAVVPLSLAIAAGGAVWCRLYDRTGALYAPWLSHIVVDVALMTVGFDLAFGFR